jgi:hypothetical protein
VFKNLASGSRGNEQTKNVVETSENAAPVHDLTPFNIWMGDEQIGTNRSSVSMRVWSERLVGNYNIVSTEKETEKLPLNDPGSDLKTYGDESQRQRQR